MKRLKKVWNNLKALDKSELIRYALDNGLSIDEVKEAWNLYAEGGSLDTNGYLNNLTEKPFSYTNIPAVRYDEGGSIYIKPENRGKFTELKERTGHSTSWFIEHGSPALKKMAVFANNARKWKHEEGGHLFDGETEQTQYMWVDPFTSGEADRLMQATSLEKDNAAKAVQKNVQVINQAGALLADKKQQASSNEAYFYQHPEDIGSETIREVAMSPVLESVHPEFYALAAPATIKLAGNTASNVLKGINTWAAKHPILSGAIDTWLTLDGVRNFASDNGFDKTLNYLNKGNYGRAALSGTGDILDLLGAAGLITKISKPARMLSPNEKIELLFNNYLDAKTLARRAERTETLADFVKNTDLAGDSKEMYDLLIQSGVDPTKLKSADLAYLNKIRKLQLSEQMSTRYIHDDIIGPDESIMLLYEPQNNHAIGSLTYSYITNPHKGFNWKYGVLPTMIENLTEGTENVRKGITVDLYDAAIQKALDNKLDGLISGLLLLSPEKTTHIWLKYYPTRLLLSNRGVHKYQSGNLSGQPIVLLDKPSKNVLPTKSWAFNPEIIDNNGYMHINPMGDRLHSTGGPLYPFSFVKGIKDMKQKEQYTTTIRDTVSLSYNLNPEIRQFIDNIANKLAISDALKLFPQKYTTNKVLRLRNKFHSYDGDSEQSLLMEISSETPTPEPEQSESPRWFNLGNYYLSYDGSIDPSWVQEITPEFKNNNKTLLLYSGRLPVQTAWGTFYHLYDPKVYDSLDDYRMDRAIPLDVKKYHNESFPNQRLIRVRDGNSFKYYAVPWHYILVQEGAQMPQLQLPVIQQVAEPDTVPQTTPVSQEETASSFTKTKTQRTSPAEIPLELREGLVEVKNGVPYYEFKGYSNEAILAAIEEAMLEVGLKSMPKYKDVPRKKLPAPKTSTTLLSLKSPSLTQETKGKGLLGTISEGLDTLFRRRDGVVNNPEETEVYAYPSRTVNVWSIHPDVALKVLEKLKTGKKTKQDTHYYLAPEPVPNYKIGEEMNDSVFHYVGTNGSHLGIRKYGINDAAIRNNGQSIWVGETPLASQVPINNKLVTNNKVTVRLNANGRPVYFIDNSWVLFGDRVYDRLQSEKDIKRNEKYKQADVKTYMEAYGLTKELAESLWDKQNTFINTNIKRTEHPLPKKK